MLRTGHCGHVQTSTYSCIESTCTLYHNLAQYKACKCSPEAEMNSCSASLRVLPVVGNQLVLFPNMNWWFKTSKIGIRPGSEPQSKGHVSFHGSLAPCQVYRCVRSPRTKQDTNDKHCVKRSLLIPVSTLPIIDRANVSRQMVQCRINTADLILDGTVVVVVAVVAVVVVALAADHNTQWIVSERLQVLMSENVA